MISTSSNLWDQALLDLRSKIDDESFTTWLEPVRFVGQEENIVRLEVPGLFDRNWIANNYQAAIEGTLSILAGRPVVVEYLIGGDDAGARDTLGAIEWSPTERRAIEISHRAGRHERPAELIHYPLNRNYSFDNFVVGESNRFAYAAAQAVADPTSRAYNPLFIYGGVGLGKTHLMQAIGQELLSYGAHFNVLYVSSEAFMNAFIDAVAQKKMTEFRNCFRNVDLLLVDDVQFFSGAEQTQTEFFHTFNVLYDAGKKIVISSDHPPKELHELEERLRSRFEWGLIVDIQPPDLETRVAILRKKAAMRGLELSPEVTMFIAERVKSNLRKLEGALTRLAAHAALTREAITVDLARGLLGPFLTGEEPRRISVEKIQMAVCNYFNVTLHELTGQNRSRKYAMPRQLAAYLCRELTGASFPDLARKFGGRDHTSIIHACNKVRKDMATQLNLQNLIKYLTKLIKEEPTVDRPE
ncbi:MAG: chromosomal replication initiator protein DnaA [bacterium]|nr:chromosomal replication initiator protein DnaA [bacterium]